LIFDIVDIIGRDARAALLYFWTAFKKTSACLVYLFACSWTCPVLRDWVCLGIMLETIILIRVRLDWDNC
jgi:hypothetical protein